MGKCAVWIAVVATLSAAACSKNDGNGGSRAPRPSGDAVPKITIGAPMVVRGETLPTEYTLDAPLTHELKAEHSLTLAAPIRLRFAVSDVQWGEECGATGGPYVGYGAAGDERAEVLRWVDEQTDAELPAGDYSVYVIFQSERACPVEAATLLVSEVGGSGTDAGDGEGDDDDGDDDDDDDGGSGGDGVDVTDGGDDAVDGVDDGGGDGGGFKVTPDPALVGTWEAFRREAGHLVVERLHDHGNGSVTERIWAAGKLVLDVDYSIQVDLSASPRTLLRRVDAVRVEFVDEPIVKGMLGRCLYSNADSDALNLSCGNFATSMAPRSLEGATAFVRLSEDPDLELPTPDNGAFKYDAASGTCKNYRGDVGYNEAPVPGECTSFGRMDWDDQDLSGKAFQGSRFESGSFYDARIGSTDFRGCKFGYANFVRAQASSVNFAKSAFDSSIKIEAGNFSGASFAGSTLSSGGFLDATLDRANFSDAKMTYPGFSRTSVRSADFRKAKLSSGQAINSDFSYADFRGADLQTFRFDSESKLSGAKYDATTKLPFAEDEARRRGMIKETNEE